MSISNAQQILAALGPYRGKADGLAGPKTLEAAIAVLAKAKVRTAGWTPQRMAYGAAQVLLDAAGYEPGHVDGFWGHNSQNAWDAWDDKRAGRPALVLDRTPAPGKPNGSARWPLQRDMAAFYGPAGGPRCTAGVVRLPFAHVLAWDTSQKITTFRCHELVAPAFQFVFEEAARQFGEAEYRRLRLDRFGGCYNLRKMRGGSAISTHGFGAAVDLDPENNQLKWGSDRASFARAEYVPFWNIVEGQGLVSLGRARNFDWMHFQGVRL